jgi:hypothetical protein
MGVDSKVVVLLSGTPGKADERAVMLPVADLVFRRGEDGLVQGTTALTRDQIAAMPLHQL